MPELYKQLGFWQVSQQGQGIGGVHQTGLINTYYRLK